MLNNPTHPMVNRIMKRLAQKVIHLTSFNQLKEIFKYERIIEMLCEYIDWFINNKLASELQNINFDEIDISNEFEYNGNRYVYTHDLIHCNTSEYAKMTEIINDFNEEYIGNDEKYIYEIPNSEFISFVPNEVMTNIIYDEYEINYNINKLFKEKVIKNDNPVIDSYSKLNEINDNIGDEYKSQCFRHDNNDEIPILYINGNILTGLAGDIHQSLIEEYGDGSNYPNKIVKFNQSYLEWDDLDTLKIPAARAIQFNNVVIVLYCYGGYNAKEIVMKMGSLMPNKKIYYHLPISNTLKRLAMKR